MPRGFRVSAYPAKGYRLDIKIVISRSTVAASDNSLDDQRTRVAVPSDAMFDNNAGGSHEYRRRRNRYVGLVSGTCLAETGNDVTCVDCDRKKIDVLNRGHIPIYEPGLAELVARNVADGRLRSLPIWRRRRRRRGSCFSPWNSIGRDGPSICRRSGRSSSRSRRHRARLHRRVQEHRAGGNQREVAARLKELTGREIDVASNPEFLKEGMAIDDFMKPDRVVVGARRQEVTDVLADLYQPYLRTDKRCCHVAERRDDEVRRQCDAFDEDQFHQRVGRVCEGAGPTSTRFGGHRPRQPHRFRLPVPGVGYAEAVCQGRSRAGRDARQHGVEPDVLDAVTRSTSVKSRADGEDRAALRRPAFRQSDRRLGLAFKPGTDDVARRRRWY